MMTCYTPENRKLYCLLNGCLFRKSGFAIFSYDLKHGANFENSFLECCYDQV